VQLASIRENYGHNGRLVHLLSHRLHDPESRVSSPQQLTWFIKRNSFLRLREASDGHMTAGTGAGQYST
jgi:hypothetical protein